MTDLHDTSLRDDEPVPCIRVTGPAAIVGSIPALLGFHPTDSLVALLIGEDRRVRCTMRVDLVAGIASHAERIADICRRADATTVLLAVYAPAGTETWAGEVQAAIELLDDEGLTVSDALLVDEGRFRSFLCRDQTCCPPEGRAVPDEVTEFEAHRVTQGFLSVSESRETAQEVYRPRPDLAPAREVYDSQENFLERPMAERCSQALSDALELVEAHDAGHPVGRDLDDARARLALLLHDSTVRDYALAVLARDHDLRSATRAMTWLALTTVEALRPPVAASAACLQAATGDDPIAGWALLDLAEGESLARLVRVGMENGVHPDHVQSLLIESLPAVQEQIDRS